MRILGLQSTHRPPHKRGSPVLFKKAFFVHWRADDKRTVAELVDRIRRIAIKAYHGFAATALFAALIVTRGPEITLQQHQKKGAESSFGPIRGRE